ncbi:MAG TPA: hypothetical protein VHR47_08850 [Bacillota bacterium]|nr:hypothetical protein [Bacillota bacterium]
MKANNLESLLSSQNKEELIRLLIQLAETDRHLENRIRLAVSSNDLEIERKNIQTLIRGQIRKYKDHGFIPYGKSFWLADDLLVVLDKAAKSVENGDIPMAIEFYLCLTHEIIPVLSHTDDSAGVLSDMVRTAMEALTKMSVAQHLEETAEWYFERLLKEVGSKKYAEWPDWQIELMAACANLVRTNAQRQKLERKMAECDKERSSDEWCSKTFEEGLVKLRYSLIQRFDGTEEGDRYLYQNLSFPEIRGMAIQREWSKKNYDAAERFCLDGERQDAKLAGLLHQWRKMRYETYKQSLQIEKQRELALKLALQEDFEAYQELRSLYTDEEWRFVYPSVIESMERKGYSAILPEVLILEEEKTKLLGYIRRRPALITHYDKYLLPDYAESVYDLYLEFIRNEAESASDRRGYKKVCDIIRRLIKDGGKASARSIIDELMEKYPKRTSLHDELLKVKMD